MTNLPILCRSLALSLVLGGASLAHAQTSPPSAEPQGYRDAIDEAVTEYEDQHFEEARSLFARAHAIYPNARSARGLGMVEFELRNYGTSIEHLEAALASPVRPLEGALRTQTEALLERAKRFVGHVALRVTPGASRVIVDGVPVEVAPGKSLVLQVGDHTLEVQAEGYSPERRTVSLRGGETQTLQIALQAPVARTLQPVSEPPVKQRAPWALMGTGGALAVGGGVLVYLAMKKKSDVESAPVGSKWTDYENAHAAVPVLSGVGFTMVGVGLASFGVGLTWKLLTRSGERQVPVNVTGQRNGIVVSGHF